MVRATSRFRRVQRDHEAFRRGRDPGVQPRVQPICRREGDTVLGLPKADTITDSGLGDVLSQQAPAAATRVLRAGGPQRPLAWRHAVQTPCVCAVCMYVRCHPSRPHTASRPSVLPLCLMVVEPSRPPPNCFLNKRTRCGPSRLPRARATSSCYAHPQDNTE